jgi:hypothetical protein
VVDSVVAVAAVAAEDSAGAVVAEAEVASVAVTAVETVMVAEEAEIEETVSNIPNKPYKKRNVEIHFAFLLSSYLSINSSLLLFNTLIDRIFLKSSNFLTVSCNGNFIKSSTDPKIKNKSENITIFRKIF